MPVCVGGGGGIFFGFILGNIVETDIPVYMKSMVRGPTLGFSDFRTRLRFGSRLE